MPVQVLHGGVNLIEKVEELDKKAAETKAQLALKIQQEKEQQKRIDVLSNVNLLSQQKYDTLEVLVLLYLDIRGTVSAGRG